MAVGQQMMKAVWCKMRWRVGTKEVKATGRIIRLNSSSPFPLNQDNLRQRGLDRPMLISILVVCWDNDETSERVKLTKIKMLQHGWRRHCAHKDACTENDTICANVTEKKGKKKSFLWVWKRRWNKMDHRDQQRNYTRRPGGWRLTGDCVTQQWHLLDDMTTDIYANVRAMMQRLSNTDHV